VIRLFVIPPNTTIAFLGPDSEMLFVDIVTPIPDSVSMSWTWFLLYVSVTSGFLTMHFTENIENPLAR
jgi:hypothetical protein